MLWMYNAMSVMAPTYYRYYWGCTISRATDMLDGTQLASSCLTWPRLPFLLWLCFLVVSGLSSLGGAVILPRPVSCSTPCRPPLLAFPRLRTFSIPVVTPVESSSGRRRDPDPHSVISVKSLLTDPAQAPAVFAEISRDLNHDKGCAVGVRAV